MECISMARVDVFKYESIKIMVDHGWNRVGLEYFKVIFWLYFLFFMLPLGVDLFYFEHVINVKQVTLTH
jgi:hypothetical protein